MLRGIDPEYSLDMPNDPNHAALEAAGGRWLNRPARTPTPAH